MAYDGRILRRARERFEADRAVRRDMLARRRETLFHLHPRLRELNDSLRSTTGHVLSAALRKGADPLPELNRIRLENLRLQEEKRTILRQLGQAPDFLDDVPACPLCNDSGWRDGRLCGGKNCLRSYYAEEQQKELSRMLDLGNQSFDTFSLDWYPPPIRQYMREVLDTCRRFAFAFGRRSENLLMFGPPGVGKTFLSAAIAREVSGAGFSVVYDSAGNVFSRFETEKFTREEAAGDDVSRALSCDLLILDDLGTELNTAFVQTALYRIVNTRILERRSTIISTNISIDPDKEDDELSRRYTPQIVSRLKGEYRILAFFGDDIRKKKKERKGAY